MVKLTDKDRQRLQDYSEATGDVAGFEALRVIDALEEALNQAHLAATSTIAEMRQEIEYLKAEFATVNEKEEE